MPGVPEAAQRVRCRHRTPSARDESGLRRARTCRRPIQPEAKRRDKARRKPLRSGSVAVRRAVSACCGPASSPTRGRATPGVPDAARRVRCRHRTPSARGRAGATQGPNLSTTRPARSANRRGPPWLNSHERCDRGRSHYGGARRHALPRRGPASSPTRGRATASFRDISQLERRYHLEPSARDEPGPRRVRTCRRPD